jgi:hypothetical protein
MTLGKAIDTGFVKSAGGRGRNGRIIYSCPKKGFTLEKANRVWEAYL